MHPLLPETAKPPSRRERNKQRTRERLYGSALTLFALQGYDNTSIDEIAEHADVARGTFFNYFQHKEDLISAWGEQRRHTLEAALAEPDPSWGDGAVCQLRRCMGILTEINENERDVALPLLTAWVKTGRPLTETPYVAEIFTGIIEAGQEEGSIATGVNARQVGHILRDIYFGALYRWTQRTDAAASPSLGEELQTALTLLINGLAVTPQSPPPDQEPADSETV